MEVTVYTIVLSNEESDTLFSLAFEKDGEDGFLHIEARDINDASSAWFKIVSTNVLFKNPKCPNSRSRNNWIRAKYV